jgi:amino acid transporter
VFVFFLFIIIIDSHDLNFNFGQIQYIRSRIYIYIAVAWVEEAFGPKASLLCGYFHWVSGATDNAIYPSLFLKYVASYMNSKAYFGTDMIRFLFTAGITIVLSIINYSGLDIVGNLSIVICIVSMSPFIIMVLLSLPTIDPNRWFILPDPSVTFNDTDDSESASSSSNGFLYTLPIIAGISWRPLLNNLFWNLNSFDVGASFAGEVRDPERVFPRAMFLSVIFVIFSYLLPLLAALGAIESHQNDWDAGYFTDVAVQIGGPWLGAYTVLAAAISNIALFEAEMSGDAYQLMGMADRGLIPKWFTKRSRFGTPVNGIITGTIVIVLMSVADFDQLVEMLNFAYSLSILLEYAAFIKLRFSDHDGTFFFLSLALFVCSSFFSS